MALFAGSLGLLVAGDTDLGASAGEVDAAGVLLSALATFPLVLRRRAPLAVFAFTGLASAVLSLVAAPAGPPLGPTVALYSVAAAGTRGVRAFAVVLGVFVLHETATGLALGAFPGAETLLGTALWGGAWLAGDRTRLRSERMAELEERAARAEEEAERERRLAAAEERMRIARDLHDGAGHAINVILVHAGLGRMKSGKDPAAARAAFATIEEVARDTVGEIDQLVRVLRADAPGDGVEPPPGLAALDALLARRRSAGLDVTAATDGAHRPLPPRVDQSAYRIVQEALTNAARHGAGSAHVQVAFAPDALELSVTNPLAPGGGAPAGPGNGIVGMRERIDLLGGRLEAGPRAGRFEVRATLPLARERS